MLRDEDGTTLVEILIAVVIMSLLMTAILGAMGTSTAASGTHKRMAEAHAVLLSSAERLKSNTEVPYVDCATTTNASYVAAVSASQIPDGIVSGDDVDILSIKYWQGGSTFSALCHDSTTPILKIQQIELRVVASGGISEELTILKRGTP